MSSLCPSCYLDGGREDCPAGHSTLGVLIYRLEKSAGINYLQPIVSTSILCAFSAGKGNRLFFAFNCIGILSVLLRIEMEEAEAGRAGVRHLGEVTVTQH